MAESVIIHESELLIYKNQLVRYTEFLMEKVGEFRSIMSGIQTSAFEDELLNARLSVLLMSVLPVFKELDQIIGSEVQTGIQQTVSEIDEAASGFSYPGSLLDRISSLLSVFG